MANRLITTSLATMLLLTSTATTAFGTPPQGNNENAMCVPQATKQDKTTKAEEKLAEATKQLQDATEKHAQTVEKTKEATADYESKKNALETAKMNTSKAEEALNEAGKKAPQVMEIQKQIKQAQQELQEAEETKAKLDTLNKSLQRVQEVESQKEQANVKLQALSPDTVDQDIAAKQKMIQDLREIDAKVDSLTKTAELKEVNDGLIKAEEQKKAPKQAEYDRLYRDYGTTTPDSHPNVRKMKALKKEIDAINANIAELKSKDPAPDKNLDVLKQELMTLKEQQKTKVESLENVDQEIRELKEKKKQIDDLRQEIATYDKTIEQLGTKDKLTQEKQTLEAKNHDVDATSKKLQGLQQQLNGMGIPEDLKQKHMEHQETLGKLQTATEEEAASKKALDKAKEDEKEAEQEKAQAQQKQMEAEQEKAQAQALKICVDKMPEPPKTMTPDSDKPKIQTPPMTQPESDKIMTPEADKSDMEGLRVITGQNSYDIKTNASFEVKLSGDVANLVDYKVDGKKPEDGKVKVTSGSTVFTFTPSYLKELGEGTHTLEATFKDSATSKQETVKHVFNIVNTASSTHSEMKPMGMKPMVKGEMKPMMAGHAKPVLKKTGLANTGTSSNALGLSILTMLAGAGLLGASRYTARHRKSK